LISGNIPIGVEQVNEIDEKKHRVKKKLKFLKSDAVFHMTKPSEPLNNPCVYA
jgi:hypothetical protein